MNPVKTGLGIVIMGFLANLFFGSGAENNVDIPALIKNGALVIDVRSAGEFSGGHIDGAINIPHNVMARDIANKEPEKGSTIIIYCHSGARSIAAIRALHGMGYTHIVNGRTLHHMRKLLGE